LRVFGRLARERKCRDRAVLLVTFRQRKRKRSQDARMIAKLGASAFEMRASRTYAARILQQHDPQIEMIARTELPVLFEAMQQATRVLSVACQNQRMRLAAHKRWQVGGTSDSTTLGQRLCRGSAVSDDQVQATALQRDPSIGGKQRNDSPLLEVRQ